MSKTQYLVSCMTNFKAFLTQARCIVLHALKLLDARSTADTLTLTLSCCNSKLVKLEHRSQSQRGSFNWGRNYPPPFTHTQINKSSDFQFWVTSAPSSESAVALAIKNRTFSRSIEILIYKIVLRFWIKFKKWFIGRSWLAASCCWSSPRSPTAKGWAPRARSLPRPEVTRSRRKPGWRRQSWRRRRRRPQRRRRIRSRSAPSRPRGSFKIFWCPDFCSLSFSYINFLFYERDLVESQQCWVTFSTNWSFEFSLEKAKCRKKLFQT